MLSLTELSAGEREAPLTLPIKWALCCLGPRGYWREKEVNIYLVDYSFFFLIPALELQRHCKDELCVFFLLIKLPSSELKVLRTSVWVFSFIGYPLLLPYF